MDTCLELTTPVAGDLNSDSIWVTLYPILLRLAKRWVYSAYVSSWFGQECDIAWDIVLVAIQRTYEYTLKAQRENIPIASLKRLSITIAKNYFHDLRRKDSRLQPFDREGYSPVEWSIHDEIDSAEAVLDKVHEEWLFNELAIVIADYPPKMRKALLIDISIRMEFGSQPTPLQAAFLEVGIQLQGFENLLPEEPVMRARHSSLVSLGYKKIAILFRTREFTEVVPASSRT
jgi:DNA-directed RNA polymerase specialized sigma24 family protein